MTTPPISDRSLATTLARRARVLRYGVWQMRDFVFDRGLSLIIVGCLLGYFTVAPLLQSMRYALKMLPPNVVAKWGGMDAARARMMTDVSEKFIGNFLGAMVFIGVIFVMNGIVASDRKQGYYRFLFTKPLAPWRYYGQAFVINTIGFVGVLALLGGVYSLSVSPILSVRLLAVSCLMFLTYAGITFVLSAAARWDWLSLVTVTVGANFLWLRFKDSHSVFARLLYLLPPLHRTDEVYSALAKSQPLPWPLIEWYVAYGVTCFIAGLVVLRYRRLAIV